MLKYANNWGGLTPEHKSFWDEMENKYQPARGKANTVGGELIRAMNRIVYRFYNDGDTVRRYYGGMYNYLMVCDEFLCEKIPNYSEMSGICGTDEYYEEVLAHNTNETAKYLMKHPELFEEPNYFDCTEGGPLAEYPEDEDEDDWDEELEDEDY
jgi:hypothetical protein